MGRRLAVPLSLLTASLSLALLPSATAAVSSHVPDFDLLVRPVAVSKLPLVLRTGFEGFGKHSKAHGRRARVGQVRLSEGIVMAAGNYRWICTNYKTKGEPKAAGSGGCSPRSQASQEGLINICAGRSRKVQIDGLVPNGVTTIQLDRGGIGPTILVPVVRNAFAASLPHADLTFRGLNATGETVIEHEYPLADAHGSGCYSFFEARTE